MPADKKITELTAATTVGPTDLFEIVQSSTNKKATLDLIVIKQDPLPATPGTLNEVIALLQSYGLCSIIVASLLFGATAVLAATFGDIPASLALPANQSVRRNAGNTAFEAYTPGSGGSSAFIDLTDVPGSYSGSALRGVRVKATEDGLEFFSTPTATPTATSTPTATPTATATATATPTPTASIPHVETLVVNGGGIVLSTGAKAPDKLLHVSGTLKKWSLVCTPSGSVTVDILRAANGAGLPVTSIIGGSGTKPFISSDVENTGTNFTSWTSIVLADGDNITISLSGITDVTYVQLKIWFDQ